MTTVASVYTPEQLITFREQHVKFVLKGCVAVLKAYVVFKDEHDIVRNLADHAANATNDLCFDNVMEIQAFDDTTEERMLFLELDHLLENIACDETEAMHDYISKLTVLTAKLIVRFNINEK